MNIQKKINIQKMTVKNIRELLNHLNDFDEILYNQLINDTRKGVHQVARQWFNRIQNIEKSKMNFTEKNIWEDKYHQQGYIHIAGIDEVGRGPLAGPVVAAAVILDPAQPIYGLKDSKQLSLKERLKLFNQIKEKAISYSISEQSSQKIDKLNIYEATRLAMKEAVETLETIPDLLLVDAMKIDTTIPQIKLIKGDDRSNSIAAASILAKVTRDNLMEKYSQKYPYYGWETNKGYGTSAHIKGLETYGPTPIHRKSFNPVSKYF